MPAGDRDPLSVILATPVTRTVFLHIANGEGDLARIVQRTRMLRPAAERAVKEFEAMGLVEQKDGKWAVTPTGAALRSDAQKNLL